MTLFAAKVMGKLGFYLGLLDQTVALIKLYILNEQYGI
jgi:hypothetical protein